MKAYRIIAFDAPPSLVETESPAPAPGEVKLKIDACGLNFADLLMAKGQYQDTPEPPFTLGMEAAGTVIAHGPGVDGPAIGTRVIAFGGTGGLAQEGCFPVASCRPIPDEMTAVQAAAFQVAYGTSHLGLTRRARLAAGETLLVLGAAGGVGLTAVEIGKQLGARVIAVARGEAKLDVARAAGADHLIDAEGDVKAQVKALGGADVVYDPVGGDLFKQALSATRPEGRILTIGFASGDIPRPGANILLVKNIDVIGFYWGAYARLNPQAMGDSLSELMDWFRDGRITPHISHSLPLSQVADGLDLLASRRSTGKVVITVD